jgi:hypothetical protein
MLGFFLLGGLVAITLLCLTRRAAMRMVVMEAPGQESTDREYHDPFFHFDLLVGFSCLNTANTFHFMAGRAPTEILLYLQVRARHLPRVPKATMRRFAWLPIMI